MEEARITRTEMRRQQARSAVDGIRTPDGRYMVVRGRLWRTTDPSIPEHERVVLVRELMSARTEISRTRAAGDADGGRAARQAVDEAKRALGERGPVWWQDGAPDQNRRMAHNTPYRGWFIQAERNVNAILRLLEARSVGASICPSDVARAQYPLDWRTHLDSIREAARHLARRGLIEISQRGLPLDPDRAFRGPVRLRRL